MRAAWTPSPSRRSRRPSFPLPPRLEGLRRLAYNLHWAWHPRTRNLWSLIDRTAWNRYRNPIPVISGPTEWSRLLDDEKFLAEYHDVLADFDRYMANGSDHWFQRTPRRQARRPDRLLLRRVRHPRVARHLLGRPRRPRRRPHEVGQRHGPAVRRRRAALPQGLLPPVDRRRRPPGAQLPRLRPDAACRSPRVQDDERPAADRHRRAARARPVGRGLAGPGRPRAGPAARHRRRGERGRGPADHPHPVRPRPRDAAPPGARPRHRRRARDPGARPRARRCGTSTRATRRSCSPSAPASTSRAGAAARRRVDAGQARQRVHDPHAGLGRQRALRRRPRPARRGPAARRRRRAGRATSSSSGWARTATAASST